MNRSLTTTVGLVLAVATLPGLATAQGAEWTTLLDGSSPDGWRVLGDANWELADGAVSANSGGGFLVSEESYGDFELRLEFWVDEPANSGIFIRCSDPQNVTDRNCYEVNIYDTRADQTYRTGGIVHLAAPSAVINAGGQWNTYQIRARGSRLAVVLNGTQVVDTTDDQFARGPIALQYGAGTVRFRNVQIRSLVAPTPPVIGDHSSPLRPLGGEGNVGISNAVLREQPEMRALRVVVEPGGTRIMHAHDAVQFHLFVPISGPIELNLEGGVTVDVQPWHTYYLEGGTQHGFHNTGSTPVEVMEIFIR